MSKRKVARTTIGARILFIAAPPYGNLTDRPQSRNLPGSFLPAGFPPSQPVTPTAQLGLRFIIFNNIFGGK
jgi:hypothetical protein